VHDQFEVTLIDTELLTELELITDLMIAANGSASSLSTQAIDGILSVVPVKPRSPAATEAIRSGGPTARTAPTTHRWSQGDSNP
jgi:hypothetical protein